MNLALDLPINQLSFGQCSVAILRECHRRGLHPNVFPLAGQKDISTQRPDDAFNQWLDACINKAQKDHSRKHTAIKLWHIGGSLQSYSATDSRLITFHELDQLTRTELNILRAQDRVYVTSRFSQTVFKLLGVESEYLPLGFDAHNFATLTPRPKIEGTMQWGLGGKFEARKGHPKVLNLWAKRYGNKKEHRLNVAVTNPFLKPEHLNALVSQALEGKPYQNINFVPYMGTNVEYSQFLQTNDVFFALSGGEGRGLPEFHATALGAWPIALRAHAYTDYLNDENAIMVNPSGKRPAVDGIFFHPNTPFNVGNLFDFDEQDFHAACDVAEARVKTGLNTKGLELQKLTYAATLDVLLKDLK